MRITVVNQLYSEKFRKMQITDNWKGKMQNDLSALEYPIGNSASTFLYSNYESYRN